MSAVLPGSGAQPLCSRASGQTPGNAGVPGAWRVFAASAVLELALLNKNRAFVALTVLAAVSFLVMVSLFGLTGSYAPVALINRDGGAYAQSFIAALDGAHHSFALKTMSEADADKALRSGRLVGVITIPANFSADIERGITVPVDVRIDNVNADLTHDVQRALPAAIVAFGRSIDSRACVCAWSSTTCCRTTPATSPTWWSAHWRWPRWSSPVSWAR